MDDLNDKIKKRHSLFVKATTSNFDKAKSTKDLPFQNRKTDNINIDDKIPKTKIEKVIETLNEISEYFASNDNKEFLMKTCWVIKEVISNKMYNYSGQVDPEQISLLKLYSPNDFEEEKYIKKSNYNSVSNTNVFSDEEDNEINKHRDSISRKPTKTVSKISHSKTKPVDVTNFGVNFDVFKYSEIVGRNNLLMQVTLASFSYKEIYNLLKTSYYDGYIEELRIGYTSEPNSYYHNDFHAADVLQGMADMIVNGQLDIVADLTNLDILASLYSALIHDYKHPGFNNGFLINSKSDIAFQFNDKSCLENYHLAEAFKILKKPERNIFEKFELNDFKGFRKRVIESVLATDMMNHSKLVGIMTSRLIVHQGSEDGGFHLASYLEENKDTNKFDIQQDFISFVLHAVDIGHAAKPFDLEVKWTKLVTEEFHNQGDIEKKLGLPVSFLCDRNTSNLPSSQIGFIAGIVIPTFQLVAILLPKTEEYMRLIKISKEEWEKLKEMETKSIL